MKKSNLITLSILLIALMSIGGCISSPNLVNYDTTNDPIVKIIDVVDVKEGQDLVQVTTKSGQVAIVDKAMLDFYNKTTGAATANKANISFDNTGKALIDDDNLVPFLPVVDVELGTMATLGKNLLGWIPGLGDSAKGIVGALLSGWVFFERRRKNAEIAARLRGETELTNTKLLGLAMATGIELSKNAEVKKIVSEIMPDGLKPLFDDQTAGVRSPSNK